MKKQVTGHVCIWMDGNWGSNQIQPVTRFLHSLSRAESKILAGRRGRVPQQIQRRVPVRKCAVDCKPLRLRFGRF